MMVKQIFVNLPVADLKASIAFFTRLGFSFKQEFTDDTATCMIVGENIFAMLLMRERFAGFAPHPPADARAATEVLLALPLDSRDAVDAMVREATGALDRAGADIIISYWAKFYDRIFGREC